MCRCYPCSFAAAALIGLDWMGRWGEDLQCLDSCGWWLAGHQAMRLNAGSQTYVSWLPVRTNSMVDPPKSITTYLTYHDSAMTLSMFNYIEIRESFGAPNHKPARFSAASNEGAFPGK